MGKYQYFLYSSRPTYGATPDFIHRDASPPNGGFQSLYAVTEDTAEALKQAGTTKGFKGVVWSERLWLDFDQQDSARRAERCLREMGYDYLVYDTGNRGLHFGILRNAEPSHLLPLMDKAWVKRHFPDADLSIYTHLHPFRLPGTEHHETGRRKGLVYHSPGSALTLPKFEEEELQLGSIGNGQYNRSGSIFDNFRIAALTTPLSEGTGRHQTLVRLLYALKNHGVEPQMAYWWTCEWNKLLAEPKSIDEIEKAFKSIFI